MTCKPGDIAIIIGVRDERCSANIGALVTVKSQVLTDGPLEWMVVNPSRPLLLFSELFPELPVCEAQQEWAWALDRHLMPVSSPGETAAESQKNPEKIPETV